MNQKQNWFFDVKAWLEILRNIFFNTVVPPIQSGFMKTRFCYMRDISPWCSNRSFSSPGFLFSHTSKKQQKSSCNFHMHFLTPSFFFLFIWVFFHEHSLFTGQQGKGEGIILTPLYHFNPLHRHLEISRAITAESSPLHIDCSRTRTGNLWFPSASR